MAHQSFFSMLTLPSIGNFSFFPPVCTVTCSNMACTKVVLHDIYSYCFSCGLHNNMHVKSVGILRKQHFPGRYQILETRFSKAVERVLDIKPS